ncbi:MAG TPA: DUF1801 domain-containing protein [Rhizomicrobium sp.]
MTENKTKATKASVGDYVAALPDETKRSDAKALIKMMKAITGEPAKMWGPSIIGFGSLHYVYESGREGDMPLLAFSPRKPAIVLYGLRGAKDADAKIAKLGKVTTGKGCVYVKKLADIDMAALEKLARESAKTNKAKHK